ncbi:hypothetical protein HOLleu_06504 [Holothuria leucospilota]|uniref:Uncharacterized protein n=1 Tax=Holothuria leucospilota TaxID=206669 RepID=A0A9Q1HJL6_HOLLE|nr:hypothetical protein HOLleu_06504 [Holothuria leucospilota]
MSLGHTCVKLFYEFKLTFDEAENACNAFRVNDCDGTVLSAGHLVSIQSQEQQDVLVELVKRTLSAEQLSPITQGSSGNVYTVFHESHQFVVNLRYRYLHQVLRVIVDDVPL